MVWWTGVTVFFDAMNWIYETFQCINIVHCRPNISSFSENTENTEVIVKCFFNSILLNNDGVGWVYDEASFNHL